MYKVPLKSTYRILMLLSVLGQSIFTFYPSQYLFYFSLLLFLIAFPFFIIDFKGMFKDFTLMTILIMFFVITPFILEISKNGDWVQLLFFHFSTRHSSKKQYLGGYYLIWLKGEESLKTVSSLQRFIVYIIQDLWY